MSPIFEYRCKKCGHEYEVIHYGGEVPRTCPQCDSTEAEKLMSPPAIAKLETPAY